MLQIIDYSKKVKDPYTEHKVQDIWTFAKVIDFIYLSSDFAPPLSLLFCSTSYIVNRVQTFAFATDDKWHITLQ